MRYKFGRQLVRTYGKTAVKVNYMVRHQTRDATAQMMVRALCKLLQNCACCKILLDARMKLFQCAFEVAICTFAFLLYHYFQNHLI